MKDGSLKWSFVRLYCWDMGIWSIWEGYLYGNGKGLLNVAMGFGHWEKGLTGAGIGRTTTIFGVCEHADGKGLNQQLLSLRVYQRLGARNCTIWVGRRRLSSLSI